MAFLQNLSAFMESLDNSHWSLVNHVDNQEKRNLEEFNYFNPFNLKPEVFLGLMVLKSCGMVVIESILHLMIWMFNVKKMPSRTPPIMKGLEALQWKDYLYLGINQFIEILFTFHLLYLTLSTPEIAKSFQQFHDADFVENVKNVIISIVFPIYFIFFVDDFFYYWLHRFMHLPKVYAFCHKHHHRQALPRRGYLDAGNENPMEQLGGLYCVWMAIKMLLGLYSAVNQMYPDQKVHVHSAGLLIFFVMYAALAFLNHTEYDVQLGALGLGYTVRAHEMHHRIPTCNYAQNTMIVDRILGTFKKYTSGQKVQ